MSLTAGMDDYITHNVMLRDCEPENLRNMLDIMIMIIKNKFDVKGIDFKSLAGPKEIKIDGNQSANPKTPENGHKQNPAANADPPKRFASEEMKNYPKDLNLEVRVLSNSRGNIIEQSKRDHSDLLPVEKKSISGAGPNLAKRSILELSKNDIAYGLGSEKEMQYKKMLKLDERKIVDLNGKNQDHVLGAKNHQNATKDIMKSLNVLCWENVFQFLHFSEINIFGSTCKKAMRMSSNLRKELDLGNKEQVPFDTFRILLRRYKQLKFLTVGKMRNCKPNSLSNLEIDGKLLALEKLDISRTVAVNDAVIMKFIWIFPFMTDLSIPYTGITSNALFKIEKTLVRPLNPKDSIERGSQEIQDQKQRATPIKRDNNQQEPERPVNGPALRKIHRFLGRLGSLPSGHQFLAADF